MTDLTTRRPEPGDVRRIIELVHQAPHLDNNSPYFYGMWVKEWGRSSAVAVDDRGVCGVLLGFVRPTAPRTYFAWQTCIDPTVQHADVGVRLYEHVLDELAPDGVDRLEMTVDGDNRLVRLMLSRLARRWNASVESDVLFHGEDLADGHYTEELRSIDLRRRHLSSAASTAGAGAGR